LWSRGKTNPPRKVRVKMVKEEDGVVTVSLYEDLPASATTTAAIENAPSEEKGEADIKAPEEASPTAEQSKK
jgi:large subunit ribosomal protein L31e